MSKRLADTRSVTSRLGHTGWFATLLCSLPDAVVAVDAQKRIRFMNPATEGVTGLPLEEALGKPLSNALTLLGKDGSDLTSTLVDQAMAQDKALLTERNVRLLPPTGAAAAVDVTLASVRDEKENLSGVLILFRSVSEQKRLEDALSESEERFRFAAASANDGLWDWSLKTHRVYYSPRWKALLGWAEDDVGESPSEWLGRIHPDDVARVRAALKPCLNGEATSYETEYRMVHREGGHRWMLSRGTVVKDASGQVSRLVGWQADVTERLATEERLRREALHDALTDLPNRTFFGGLLEKSFSRAQRRADYLYAVLFLDLDRFNVVNDSLGHRVGDSLLAEIARRLESSIRPGDTVARLGGDEFGILLEEIHDQDDATRVAHRVHQALAPPFNLECHEIFVTASIGIALSATPYEAPEHLLRDADTAMYRAKANGKARHEVFDKSMHARAVARLELETDLRRAVERREFQVHYQPIVSLEDGQIRGFEALARWQHPRRGTVHPVEFIPAAEETGVIIPLGWWLLYEACRQTREWQRQRPSVPPLTISVNLSCRQFTQPLLVRQIVEILKETDLDASCLKLEITESSLMEDPSAADEVLSSLRALNVQLYMDDFGTGYSSLSYLHRFHVEALKVDRSFVHNLGATGHDLEIVRAILSLGKNLGMEVIAEGVESLEQLTQLQSLDCRYGQGYFFSAPLAGAAARSLISPGPHWSLRAQA